MSTKEAVNAALVLVFGLPVDETLDTQEEEESDDFWQIDCCEKGSASCASRLATVSRRASVPQCCCCCCCCRCRCARSSGRSSSVMISLLQPFCCEATIV